MTKRILSCRIGSYGKYVLYSYEHLAGLGVKFIERTLPSSAQENEMLKDILDEFGLSVATFQVSLDPSSRADLEKKLPLFKEASDEFGTKKFFCSVKGAAPGLLAKKKREKIFNGLRAAGDFLAKHDLYLCLETHPHLVTNGSVGRETMEAVSHPNIRINFDTANMYYYNRNIDALVELDKIAEYVASVHLKDTSGEYKTWNFPALGEGIVDFPGIIKKLDAVGFKGPYTMELEGVKGVVLDLEGTKAMVKKSVEYIRPLLES